MEEFNLLPWREYNKYHANQLTKKRTLIFLVIIIFVYLIIHFGLDALNTDALTKIERLTQQIDEIEKHKEETVPQCIQKEKAYSYLLKLFNNNHFQTTCIALMTFDHNKISIQGATSTNKAYDGLLAMLIKENKLNLFLEKLSFMQSQKKYNFSLFSPPIVC